MYLRGGWRFRLKDENQKEPLPASTIDNEGVRAGQRGARPVLAGRSSSWLSASKGAHKM